MPRKPLAEDHYPGLVRPHPPLPGAAPGMHLLDLLSEPEPPARAPRPVEPVESSDPLPMVLASVAAVLAIAAVGVSIMTWLSMSSLESVAAAGGQPTVVASPAASNQGPAAGNQDEVASGAQQPLGTPADPPSPGDLRNATFSPAYRNQSLQFALPPCTNRGVRYIDVDEPRVDADASRADLFYQARSGCYGTPQLNLIGGVTASVVSRSTLRPAQCVDSVRNAPANNPILLTRAMNICVLTSADSAIGQDISQKVAMLAISAPTAGGSATARIAGWHVAP